MLRMDHAKLLEVLTSLPVSQSILPRAVCFAASRPASHAICSFIDLSRYASGPIRRCLFIDYIIKEYITPQNDYYRLFSLSNICFVCIKRNVSVRHFFYAHPVIYSQFWAYGSWDWLYLYQWVQLQS